MIKLLSISRRMQNTSMYQYMPITSNEILCLDMRDSTHAKLQSLRNAMPLNLKSQMMRFSLCVDVDIYICTYTTIHKQIRQLIH